MPASRGGWDPVGGASLYLLKPYLHQNIAFQTTSTLTADSAGGTSLSDGRTDSRQFDWGVEPAFAVWLGAAGSSGYGVRTRYFRFNGSPGVANTSLNAQQAATPPGVNPAVSTFISPSPFIPDFLPGALPPVAAGTKSFGSPSPVLLIANPQTGLGIGEDRLTFSSGLAIDAIDIEPTYAWACGGWQVVAGAGGRYLRLVQDYRAVLVNTGGGLPISVTETLGVDRRFTGGGPTISGQFNRAIGSSGFELFGSARGSLLVGTTTQTTSYTQSLDDPTGISGVPGTPVHTRINSRIPTDTDATLPVAEFELGCAYVVTLTDTELYLRAAVVNQTYFGAGTASSAEGNLSLFGCQFSAGVRY